MTVPTQADFDWNSLTVHAVDRLRAPKVSPVPDAIIRLAQQSYEGIPNPADPDGEKLHILRHTFDSQQRAAIFSKHLKNAGLLTTPQTSTRIVIDPDGLASAEGRAQFRADNPDIGLDDEALKDMGGRTVAWKTGERRNRKS